MLDVHAPDHSIGGVRDFFLHLFTITVGLLIALGLENAAETMHHRAERREAEVNIRQELEGNRASLKQAAAPVFGERNDLLKLIAGLEARSAGKPTGMTGEKVGFAEAPIPDSAWRTASTNGALSYMDYGEASRFAAAYKEQSMLEAAEEQALDDYLQFSPILETHSKDLTPAQATEALPYVRRALAHVSGMLALGAGTLEAYNDALK